MSLTAPFMTGWPLSFPPLRIDQLANMLLITSADNPTQRKNTRHWLSEFNGLWLKNLFSLRDGMQTLGQHLPMLQVFQASMDHMLKPLVIAAEHAVERGQDPDLAMQDNERIEARYAQLLYDMCDWLIVEGQFSRKRCQALLQQPEGQWRLLATLAELQWLELQYHSYGLTRLEALKELLFSLLQVIGQSTLQEAKHQPFRKFDDLGDPKDTDADYLEACAQRLISLHQHYAFDIRRFVNESPYAKLGACDYEIVPQSELYSVRLRHYKRPRGIHKNNKTIYLASPMINRCEIFDLAPGKSVIEGLIRQGYDVYMVDYGNPTSSQAELGLDFYGKEVHDAYLDLIKARHPKQPLEVMAYCMGGTLFLPYLARRAQEFEARGQTLDIKKLALMSTPIKFDDELSGHKPMRDVIREHYDPKLIEFFFGHSNVPPQVIEAGMHMIQPGVSYTVAKGFYARAAFPNAINDAAPFLYWLHHGTSFGTRAHREWIDKIFLHNQIWTGEYKLSSEIAELDGQPVDMEALTRHQVALFDYRGQRDPIAPVGSCVASERWGRTHEGNLQCTRGGLNRTIERNIGHIFVVSKTLLAEYMQQVLAFLENDETCEPQTKDL
ncbi:alpha/beta hydrolase fold [Allopseudospirillum japonicum]|uniref:Alpha/beta hydrolase fold n=1 Tax=Allopseudospirillum japonicum TaxID=64971 RepID=A0A1H6UI41_9GAMM|nr:alpha/beta fold hydrolase [Allopseudospirillum japonicum]SEI87850.1 alpha/beta hydrolase fold [Allopseudospirillum japonicum]